MLRNQFGSTPLQAASYAFVGPLLGSIGRPLGGWLASLLGMAAGTVVLIAASSLGTFGMFVAGFVVMFVFTGVGNGSTYKMIPVMAGRWAPRHVRRPSRRGNRPRTCPHVSGPTIGIASAIGPLGGVAINLTFLGFYAICVVVVWAVYLRRGTTVVQ